MTTNPIPTPPHIAPCPFCGCADAAVGNENPHDESGGYYIACPKCDASTGLRYACGDDPVPLLIEQWNRRAPATPPHISDALLAHLDALCDHKALKRDERETIEGAANVLRKARAALARHDTAPVQPAGEVPPLPDAFSSARDWLMEEGDFRQEGDWLLNPEASKMFAGGQEVIHVDTLRGLLAAGMAAQPAAGEPVAWAHFAENGNIRIWTSAPGDVQRLAKQVGFPLVPLYTAPAPAQVERNNIGSQMANVMFNLAQKPGHALTPDECALFDGLRRQWDAAPSAIEAAMASPSTGDQR